jgi:hypothetical protein
MERLNIHKWAMERAAQAWCSNRTAMIPMDITLCMAFAEILEKEAIAPKLGLATTEELIDELKARVELTYSTVKL